MVTLSATVVLVVATGALAGGFVSGLAGFGTGLIALGFWLLQTQFVKLAGVYKFDYRIAYLVPPTVMLAVPAVLFRRTSG